MLRGKFLIKSHFVRPYAPMILGLISAVRLWAPSEGTDTQEDLFVRTDSPITYGSKCMGQLCECGDNALQTTRTVQKSLWGIQFSYDGEIDSIWNADIKNHDDGTYVLEAKTYNSTIAAGQSVTLGFMAHGSSAKPAMPESITFADASASEDKRTEDTEGGDSEGYRYTGGHNSGADI